MKKRRLSWISALAAALWLAACPAARAISQKEYFDLGFTDLNQERYGPAADFLQKAAEMNPQDWKASMYLGDALNHLGRREESFAAYARSLRIHPNNPALVKFVADLQSAPDPTPVPVGTPPVTIRPNRFEIRLYASLPYLDNDTDRKIWPTGAGIGVWAGVQVDPRLTLGFRMDYDVFNSDPQEITLAYSNHLGDYYQFGEATGALTLARFVPSLRFNFNPKPESPVQPYFIGGFGVLNRSFEGIHFSATNSLTGIQVEQVDLPPTSKTMGVASATLGLPIQIPYGFKVPLEFEISTGFSAPTNTVVRALHFGVERWW